jgi:predicted ribosome quality control (RQC) complex YloA/Tae2 family protein
MYSYRSLDGILIKVGENAKENDALTESSYPNEWWLHADGGAGSHVIVCCEDTCLPRETKRDAAMLAIHHSKNSKMKSSRVNLVRVGQVWKDPRIKNHGQVYLTGEVTQLTMFMNKEKPRLERLRANRNKNG